MKQLFQLKSFASRMSLYVLSFTLIVFAAMMALFYNYSRDKLTDYAVKYTHGQLQNIATEINGMLQTVETAVNQSVWMVEKDLSEPDSLYHIIHAVVDNNDLIVSSGIAFVPYYYKEKGKYFMPYVSRMNGKMEYTVLGNQSYDYPCMDWYQIPKLLKQEYWSEPYYDQGGGNFIMSTYSKPLYDKDGEVYAIFTANISLTQFTDMVAKLKPYSSSFTFLLSRNGSYITHRDLGKIMNETIFTDAFANHSEEKEYVGREMLAGNTGTAQVTLDGKPAYTFYTSIPNIGWSVGNTCPADIILTELVTTSRHIVLFFLVAMLVLFIIIYAIIRRIVQPLSEFSKSARVIATGRFNVELPQVSSHDEIKTLHDSLVYMQQSLSDYVVELRDTTVAKERIESELYIAREIQMGMLPKIFPPFPERHDVDLFAVLRPAKEVGGDLYDFFIESDRLYFVIGDVSGKGVPASLFMAIARSLFRTFAPGELSPAAIVTKLNKAMSENNDSNMFITLIVGILDLQSGTLKLCNAGHNPPALILPDGHVSLLELSKHMFVGIMDDFIYTDEEIHLEKGSKLFLYTDGITEAENEKKELLGEEKMLKILSAEAEKDIRSMTDKIIGSVDKHVQTAAASDDLTILIIHFEPESINLNKTNHDYRKRNQDNQ